MGWCCGAVAGEPDSAATRHALITPHRHEYNGTRRRAATLDRAAAAASLRLGVR
jgi:hypothetical protein